MRNYIYETQMKIELGKQRSSIYKIEKINDFIEPEKCLNLHYRLPINGQAKIEQ